MVVSSSGSGNGTAHTNGKLNGHVVSSRRSLKRKRAFWVWAVNLIARIATWAAILTILLRCPASLEACDDTSPSICKPYFHVRNAITPRVRPYFDRYAAPYVNVAKPYYDTLNDNVLKPSRQYATLYGTPIVNKGQKFAHAQWKTNGEPQLYRLQTLTKSQYNKSIAPYLTTTGAIVGPYYNFAHKHTAQACHDYLLPGYEFTRDCAVYVYNAAAGFTKTTALPATCWAWGKTNAFLDTAVWPQLRVVYVENVQPQLVRIGERLGRYRTKVNATSQAKAADAPVEIPSSTASIASSFSRPSPQSPSTTLSVPPRVEEQESSFSEVAETTAAGAYWKSMEPPSATGIESEKRRVAREIVANDLATWQIKYTSQAKEGAAAIEEEVDEIAQALMCKSAQITGKEHLNALEETIVSEVINVKHKIQSIVEVGGSDAEEKTVSAIRAAGAAIKNKAQAVREWREDYDSKLQQAVLEATEAHLHILDETRNLALQNIGMKWAWTDGVTYKDWQKYHELKNSLGNWSEELKQLIVTHPTLMEAQELSDQIEDDGMVLAATAAQELARLKEVAHWKIQANDSTDNFETDAMQLAAAEAAQQLEDEQNDEPSGTEEQEIGTDDVNMESQSSVSEVSERPEDNTLILDPLGLSEVGSEDKDSETPEVLITIHPTVTVSLAEAGKLLKSPPVISEDVQLGSSSSHDAELEPPEESTSVEETVELPEDEMSEDESPVDDTHGPVKPLLFGAAAQSVADRSPILDDTESDDTIASVTSAAQAAYSSAVALAADRYSSALSVVSAQIQGTSKPVHEQLFSSVSAAYGGAISAASQKMNEAVAAASSGIFTAAPSPTKSSNFPDWNKVESIAAQKLKDGRLWAEIQYQSVLIGLGAATPTPTSNPEKYYEQAKYHYYAGLGLAQDRYSSFMAAASSAWSMGTATPTPTDFVGSASSLASVAGKSAASAASVADDAVKSAYTAASEGVMSVAQDAQDTIENAADAAAEQVVNIAGAVAGTWDIVVSRISADVYGQPSAIGWMEDATQSAASVVAVATDAVTDSASSASDSAAKQFDAVNKIISELVIGKEPTYSESIMSRLSAVYATATSNVVGLASDASAAASSVGDKVLSAASQATEVVKDSAQRVRDEL
ncbi:hypothetical protein E4U19_005607 [Claviceps sp. Clav32 group G5]|nr:hypothetical protein E4U19_005607 [Claviceps sp. Clav32 group G5]KAG6032071.1 hypothetical protein E4U40_006580 [Claviceps sp. LM458 group G5]KAG6046657.1 hypothetical protein E4U39_001167 [Claviceps sp. Clav50 group G5]